MIKYPESFDSRLNASKVKDEEINKYVNRAIDYMRNNDCSDYTISTGNTMIYIYKLHYQDGGGYHVIVSSDYKELYVDNEIFS